ncbi:MAG: hypothetical protein ABFD96_19355 [Armatimonadia bacterium]
MLDPSAPIANQHTTEPPEADLQDLLEKQLKIASAMQQVILRDQSSLSPRDLKDLAAAASSLISLSHRTEQTLREITTYRTFVTTVLEFLRRRSDSVGTDLLAELKAVAKELRAEEELSEAQRLV